MCRVSAPPPRPSSLAELSPRSPRVVLYTLSYAPPILYMHYTRRNDSALGEDDDSDNDDDIGRRDVSVNGSVNSDRSGSKQGSNRPRGGPSSSRLGSSRSNRSGGAGGRIQFGSEYGSDDDFDDLGSEFSDGPAGGMTPGGMSGFGGGALGGAGASSKRPQGGGGGGRTSRRVFGGARPARSNRSRGRSDFGGGGGGAMDLLREDSSAADNTPQLNASGQVIDTGIGVMPALDLARQKAGLSATPAAMLTPAPVGGGVGGVGGPGGGLFGDTSSVRSGVQGTLGVPVGAGDEWEEDDELSQVPKYLKGREELEQSLGEGGADGRAGGVRDDRSVGVGVGR